jgi:hypothetical protein
MRRWLCSIATGRWWGGNCGSRLFFISVPGVGLGQELVFLDEGKTPLGPIRTSPCVHGAPVLIFSSLLDNKP